MASQYESRQCFSQDSLGNNLSQRAECQNFLDSMTRLGKTPFTLTPARQPVSIFNQTSTLHHCLSYHLEGMPCYQAGKANSITFASRIFFFSPTRQQQLDNQSRYSSLPEVSINTSLLKVLRDAVEEQWCHSEGLCVFSSDVVSFLSLFPDESCCSSLLVHQASFSHFK